MDLIDLAISLVGIIAGIIVIYLLRKQKLMVAFGIGGSLVFLGLVLLALVYGLISGLSGWIFTGLILVVLASFVYIGGKRKWVPR